MAKRGNTYAQRLIENEYVQENLAQAAASLRDAYRRASRRRVEPTRDEKLRRQIRQAALSFREAGSALQDGRQKPKKRRGRRIFVFLVVGGGAAAAAVAFNEDLREKLLGGEAPNNEGTAAAPAAT